LARISHGVAVLAQLRGRLVAAGGHSVKAQRHRFESSVGRLQSLSPLAVLGRGYSLTRLPSGAVVRRAAETRPGDSIEILLHEGTLGARVEEVKERDERHQV
jgi:exodeoxyribonuclease VII large subunit